MSRFGHRHVHLSISDLEFDCRVQIYTPEIQGKWFLSESGYKWQRYGIGSRNMTLKSNLLIYYTYTLTVVHLFLPLFPPPPHPSDLHSVENLVK